VNNENEPVDGTSPDNLLFDRSLQINRNIFVNLWFLNYAKENDVEKLEGKYLQNLESSNSS
jgi:hypothetical protein